MCKTNLHIFFTIWIALFSIDDIQGSNPYQKYDQACRLYNQNKYLEALDTLKSIISENPDFAQSYEKLVDVYLDLNAIDAGKLFFDSLAENGRRDLAVYGKALLLQAQKKYPPAIQLLTESIRQGCVHSQLYFVLGQLFAQAGHGQEGVDFFSSLNYKKCFAANRHSGLGSYIMDNESGLIQSECSKKQFHWTRH